MSLLLRGLGLVVLLHGRTVFAQQDRADSVVAAEMASQHIPGVAVAVLRDGKPVKAKGYGFANLELEVPVMPETVFKIGSVSKQFIATGIMLLVQDGRLRLTDTVGRHVPGTPETWKGITLRHLLTHTSGILREGPAFEPLRPQPDSVVVASAFPLPLQFAPGEKWQYCNVCYFTLADIIRRVSGRPWSAFLAERVFTPAGMTATRTTTVTEMVPHRAEGYDWRDGQWEHAEVILALRPSGAFLSTILDLAKWDAELYRDRILARTSRDEMWSQVLLRDGSHYCYGLGWQVDYLNGRRRISHGGSLAGFRSSFMRFPDDRLSVVVLTNLGNANPDRIAEQVAGTYLGGGTVGR